MKRLNKNLAASKVVMALAIEGDDELVGAIVRFVKLENRGTHHRDNLFEVVGRQKCHSGPGGMVDGYRLMATTTPDQFGCAATRDEFEVISMTN